MREHRFIVLSSGYLCKAFIVTATARVHLFPSKLQIWLNLADSDRLFSFEELLVNWSCLEQEYIAVGCVPPASVPIGGVASHGGVSAWEVSASGTRRCTPPRQTDSMGRPPCPLHAGIHTPLLCEQNHRQVQKDYIPATSFAGSSDQCCLAQLFNM